MRSTKEQGSALTLVIVGTLLFFGVLGAVLWYLFSFVPEQKRQEGVRETAEIRAQEEEKGIVSTPLGGDMSICTKQESDNLVRYYDDGIRVRLVKNTAAEKRISIWDGEILARFDANGSKKWFKVPEVGTAEFHIDIATVKADTQFTCVAKPFSANYFKRVDDPFTLEE